NYFKTAWRNLWRNKSFTAINVTGLAIGMAASILILLWIQNELSIDRFYKKKNRIYWMYNRDKDADGKIWVNPNTPKMLATTLKKDYPEVEDVARYAGITFLLTAGDKNLNIQGDTVDSCFLNVFDFPLKEGNIKNSLTSSYSIVLTDKLAKKLFPQDAAHGNE